MKRHNARSSRAALNQAKKSGSVKKKSEILFDIIQRAGRPVTALFLHNATGWPYHTVTARLGTLREQGLTIDSDQDDVFCPRLEESHFCCDGTGKPKTLKTYAVAPTSPQQSLFRKVS